MFWQVLGIANFQTVYWSPLFFVFLQPTTAKPMPRFLFFLLFSHVLFVYSCDSVEDEGPRGIEQKNIVLPDKLPQYDSIPKPSALANYKWQPASRSITQQGCAGDACSKIAWHWFELAEAPNSILKDSLMAFGWYYLTGIAGAKEAYLDSVAASFFKEAQTTTSPNAPGWYEENHVWPASATANTFTLGGRVLGSYSEPEISAASHLENFDVATGSRLALNDVVDRPYDLFPIGKQIFRKQKGVPEGTSLVAAGFNFPDGGFYLPETFGIMPDGLLFVYAPQEIASFQEGEQYLLIPYSLIEDRLLPEYSYLSDGK